MKKAPGMTKKYIIALTIFTPARRDQTQIRFLENILLKFIRVFTPSSKKKKKNTSNSMSLKKQLRRRPKDKSSSRQRSICPRTK